MLRRILQRGSNFVARSELVVYCQAFETGVVRSAVGLQGWTQPGGANDQNARHEFDNFNFPKRSMGRKSLKIASKKTALDAKRAKINGKFGKRICDCARKGGSDPAQNMRLKDLLHEAKQANVPKDIIERNIKKATSKSQDSYQEVMYEAYGQGGTGFLIESMTDNVHRTVSEIRAAVNKSGGKIAAQGSVSFNFSRVGCITVDAGEKSEDDIFELATEAGAQDISTVDSEDKKMFAVITSVEDFAAVKEQLEKQGCVVDADQSGLIYQPAVPVEVDDETLEKNERLYSRLMGVPDVDAVYSSCVGLAHE